MRFVGCLAEGEDGRDAGVGAVEHRGPLLPGTGGERVGEDLLQLRPAGDVALSGQVGVVEFEAFEEFGVELRLDGADGHVLAVGGLVDVVVGGAGVEEVHSAHIRPHAGGPEGPHHLPQQRGAVDHRGVDDLPAPGHLTFQERREYTDDQEHRSAAEVAEQVEWRHRTLTGAADGVQQTGEGDIIDVVSGAVGARAVLAPAGHAPVHQSGIDLGEVVGPETETFHHSRAETLDEYVSLGDEPEHRLAVGGILEIGLDDLPAAQQGVTDLSGFRQLARPLHADHIGTEVRQQHRGVRSGTDSGKFDDPDGVQRTAFSTGDVRCGCHGFRISSGMGTPPASGGTRGRAIV